MSAEHLPKRPAWDCDACGRPWPCDPAREILAAAYAGFPAGLSDYLHTMFDLAADDLETSGGPPPDLWKRFLSWAAATERPPRQPTEHKETHPNVEK